MKTAGAEQASAVQTVRLKTVVRRRKTVVAPKKGLKPEVWSADDGAASAQTAQRSREMG